MGQLLNGLINKASLQSWNVQNSVDAVYATVLSPQQDESATQFISSDADPEILLNIPFHEVLKIRGILVLGTNDAHAPSALKVYVNARDVDGFDSVERLTPDENIMLANTSMEDAIVYRINPLKFQAASSATLLFPASFGEDTTHLCRIEFYGESTMQPVHRQLATNVVYESMANPADHKVIEEGRGGMSVVM